MTNTAADEVKYLTHNLHYAAYLVYIGAEPIDVIPSDYKAGYYDFAFKWIGNVKEYETNFFEGKAIVEPRRYIKITGQLRDMLNKYKITDVASGKVMYK